VHLDPGSHVLLARAADETGIMPATVRETWNVKGNRNNVWYRVAVVATERP
jgi:Mo-co oxidoreductase dimerisation domain